MDGGQSVLKVEGDPPPNNKSGLNLSQSRGGQESVCTAFLKFHNIKLIDLIFVPYQLFDVDCIFNIRENPVIQINTFLQVKLCNYRMYV